MRIVKLRRGRSRGRHKSLGTYLYWIISDNTFEFHSLAFVGILENHMYALGHSHQGNIFISLTYLSQVASRDVNDFHVLRLLVFGFPQQLSPFIDTCFKV